MTGKITKLWLIDWLIYWWTDWTGRQVGNPSTRATGNLFRTNIRLSQWPKQRKRQKSKKGFLKLTSFPDGLSTKVKFLKVAMQKSIKKAYMSLIQQSLIVLTHCIKQKLLNITCSHKWVQIMSWSWLGQLCLVGYSCRPWLFLPGRNGRTKLWFIFGFLMTTSGRVKFRAPCSYVNLSLAN